MRSEVVILSGGCLNKSGAEIERSPDGSLSFEYQALIFRDRGGDVRWRRSTWHAALGRRRRACENSRLHDHHAVRPPLDLRDAGFESFESSRLELYRRKFAVLAAKVLRQPLIREM